MVSQKTPYIGKCNTFEQTLISPNCSQFVNSVVCDVLTMFPYSKKHWVKKQPKCGYF